MLCMVMLSEQVGQMEIDMPRQETCWLQAIKFGGQKICTVCAKVNSAAENLIPMGRHANGHWCQVNFCLGNGFPNIVLAMIEMTSDTFLPQHINFCRGRKLSNGISIIGCAKVGNVDDARLLLDVLRQVSRLWLEHFLPWKHVVWSGMPRKMGFPRQKLVTNTNLRTTNQSQRHICQLSTTMSPTNGIRDTEIVASYLRKLLAVELGDGVSGELDLLNRSLDFLEELHYVVTVVAQAIKNKSE